MKVFLVILLGALALVVFPACAAGDHSLVFLPSYFKCTYDAKGKKSCSCWDTACNPIACPPQTPWRHRPACPKGENCAPYAGEYACRLDPYDGHASPTPAARK